MERIRKNRGVFAAIAVVGIWFAAVLYAQNRNTQSPFGIFRLSTAADTATLTTTQMSPGLLIGTPTAAATYTTPTATQFCSAFPGVAILAPGTNSNFGYDLWIRNVSAGANTITLGAGAGVTLATGNTNTVAQAHTRIFKIVPTSCAGGNNPSGTSTVTIYSGPDSAH